MHSQNRIPIISKSIEHFKPHAVYSVDYLLISAGLINLKLKNKFEVNKKLNTLSEQLDRRITLRSAMFWLKQQRLQIEVLGKIIVE